ncbi:uncharacterized protein LOC117338149 [Pecten maximus]|uniref:uncharacterized protein LOC117338149 n=1 Tax=Pecten maximus TaxID=6579 RepID=UPI0014580724|nr:uncharacterized protein LOC117338149 [Pecten maximus]
MNSLPERFNMYALYGICILYMTFWMMDACISMKKYGIERKFSLKNPNSASTNFSITRVSMLTGAHSSMMPSESRKVCKIKPIYNCMDSSMEEKVLATIRRDTPTCLFCDIGPEDYWNFHDLRNFLQNQPGNESYAITIRCHKGGNITLQWPMRAKGLTYISVRNCLLVNYTEDYLDESINHFQDTLVYYSMINCVIYIDVIHFMNVTNNVKQMTKAAKCGPEKYLIAAINRNMSYQFKTISEDLMDEVSSNLSSHTARNYQRGVSVSPITCNYTKLLSIDQSKAKHLGSKHDSVLLQNSDYPVLRLLNLSGTMLTDLPEHLDDWRLYIPRLKCLDLTYNLIKEFKTVKDYGIGSEDSSVGLLDLRHNAITSVTLNELTILQDHQFVKVDIRKNPFICDCGMADFVKYFRQSTPVTKFGVAGQYKYLLSLKCERPQSLKGRVIVDLDLEELGCSTAKTTDEGLYLIVLLGVITGILVIYILLTMPEQLDMILVLFKRLKQLCYRPRRQDEQERESNMIALETSLT